MLKLPADRYLAVIYSPIADAQCGGWGAPSYARIGKIELVLPVPQSGSDNFELRPLFVLDVVKSESGFKTVWDDGNPPSGERAGWLVAEAKRLICGSDLDAKPSLGYCIDADDNLSRFNGSEPQAEWLQPLLAESDDWKRADFERLVMGGAVLWPSDRRAVAAAPGPAPH